MPKNYKVVLFTTLLLMLPVSVLQANDISDKADLAVANILFDFSQGDEEFASYRVDDNGYLYITFADNTPDKLYGEILTALQNHPDIRDVIQDKGGPSCSLWRY